MSQRKNRRVEELRRRAKRRQSQQTSGRGPLAELAYVQRLIDGGRLQQAYERLCELEAKYPRQREVLWMLATVCRDVDVTKHRDVCRRLVDLEPDNREALLMLAHAHALHAHVTLALLAFRRLLERWPKDPRVEGLRKTIAVLEGALDDKRQESNVEPEDALEIFTLHEEIQLALSDHAFERAVELTDRILARYPGFEPAGNNRAEALFHLGRLDEAITECRRVLQHNERNCFTLATLTRLLFLRGDTDEAQVCAGRLKSFGPRTASWWCKTAETLSVLGDYRGLLEVFEQAQGELQSLVRPAGDAGYLYHFAAAAHLALGDEAQARRLWQKALKWFPGLEHAEENLRDLQAPVGERHGGWAAGFQVWLSILAYEEMDGVVKSEKRGTAAYDALRQRVLRRCPYLPRLVPILLERGDPRARLFAWWISSTSDDPRLLEALRTFALGQRGPDKMRFDALMILRQKKALPDHHLKIWYKGEWRQQVLLAWEIYSESEPHDWPREASELFSRATDALAERKADLAESLLEKALEIQPNTPEFLNNLAAAYSLQGRHKEVEELAERIHRDHPDYWFGRTNLAVMLAHRGETERAKALVEPLMEQQRLHVSEFSALCYAQACIARANRHADGAQAWADQLERVLPHDPKVKIIRSWKR